MRHKILWVACKFLIVYACLYIMKRRFENIKKAIKKQRRMNKTSSSMKVLSMIKNKQNMHET